jgi:hypothetical protein
MRGPVASRSVSVIGADAMTPLQPDTGAQSLTAQGEGAVGAGSSSTVVVVTEGGEWSAWLGS